MKGVWLARSLRDHLRDYRRLLATSTVTFCLLFSVLACARLLPSAASRWAGFVGQNVHVLVYLADDFDQERAESLADLLRRVPAVARVETVEPSQALAHLQTQATNLGVGQKVLEGLEATYFPRSLEIGLVPGGDVATQAHDLARRLRGVPGIVQVDAMSSGLPRLATWIRLGSRALWATLGSLALVTLAFLLAVFLGTRRVSRHRCLLLTQLGETGFGIRLPSSLWMVTAALVGAASGSVLMLLGWRPLVARLDAALGMTVAAPVRVLAGTDIALCFGVVLLVAATMGYLAPSLGRAQDA